MQPKLTKQDTDRWANVAGIRVHYNEAGDGPTLICTHGGGPGANAWDNTRHAFDALAQNFRVILLDLPGFGESAKDARRDGVPMDVFCARLIRDFMDGQGIGRTHLYCSSAFGATALRFGIDFPDRVGKLVVQAFSPARGRSGQTEGLKSLATFAGDPTRENMRRMMEFFIPRPELRPDPVVEARFEAAMTPGHLEARREFSSRSNSDLSPDLGRLTSEVLLLWGNEDAMIPVEDVLDALRTIPHVRAFIWGDRSGHFVAYEHADEFARVVTEFLTQ